MAGAKVGSDGDPKHLPGGRKMVELVYSSAAVKPFSAHELRSLLVEARAKNQSSHISGILLYQDGCFLQVLEGPPAAIQETFDRIEQDPRHQSVRLISRTSITRREYSDWSMGFVDVTHLSQLLEGYIDFDKQKSFLDLSQDHATRLLSLFLEGRWRERVEV